MHPKKWMMVLVVGLMLAAMVIYVVSDDESFQAVGPGQPDVQQSMPAAP